MAKQTKQQIPDSNFLENTPDALQFVYRSYLEAKNGNLTEDASIDEYFSKRQENLDHSK